MTMQTRIEAAVAGVLIPAPWWQVALADVSQWASAIAAVTGAIIGVHTVWRLVKRHRKGREK